MNQTRDHAGERIYTEKLSSPKTQLLFLALTLLFFLFFLWRMEDGNLDVLAGLFLAFFFFFLFYSVNYRRLVIHITPQSLKLTFGIFNWTVPIDHIASCSLDELPLIYKYGGAGIHFMMVRGRYRLSFNFLEYPRVVISFTGQAGFVKDLSFTTRHPQEVLTYIQSVLESRGSG